ncbi:MAG: hypothetical protein BroJett018_16750 [Chloroflexota bacterium]|nr:hypothetical protein [Chloroflexota bacterium]NOG66070.1 hypothetical protein [Chloroflexota bacterium]GIK63881.1 MAG: hypothetical protein BroJett018_16750 [Chloroflexota bacterium]
MNTKNMPVVELVLFRAKAGVSQQTLIEGTQSIQMWLAQQPGYIRRELLMTHEGQWADLVYWNSYEEAMVAGEKFMSLPEAGPLESVMDVTTIQMFHFHQMAAFEAVPVK